MATNAFYHPRQMVVDLGARLELWLYDEIAGWHGYKDKDKPVLTCLGNNEPMYVWQHISGRYFVRHFPNGNPDGHVHPALSKMSDEHRRIAEYNLRAATDAGYSAGLEVSTGNGTRLDLGVFTADGNVGFEVQRSQLTTPQATRRAALSFEAGYPTAWISDRETDPLWADYVPTARLETRGGWDKEVLTPNTAWVIIGHYERERDASRPTGWWYRREPRLVLMDDLARLMPAGEIVPAAIGTKGRVDLVFKASVEVIESCTYVGATVWNPVNKPVRPHREAVQRYSSDCHHVRSTALPVMVSAPKVVNPSASVAIRDLTEPIHAAEEPSPEPKPLAASPQRPMCGCGGVLLAPVSIARGFCERCRIDRGGVA